MNQQTMSLVFIIGRSIRLTPIFVAIVIAFLFVWIGIEGSEKAPDAPQGCGADILVCHASAIRIDDDPVRKQIESLRAEIKAQEEARAKMEKLLRDLEMLILNPRV